MYPGRGRSFFPGPLHQLIIYNLHSIYSPFSLSSFPLLFQSTSQSSVPDMHVTPYNLIVISVSFTILKYSQFILLLQLIFLVDSPMTSVW